MTEPAHKMEPLTKIQWQLIAAAERRALRRRRWRTAVAVSATGLLLSGGVGIASLQTDILRGVPREEPMLRQHGQDRVDLVAGEDMERPWTYAVYHNEAGGLCMATAPSTAEADQVHCGAAFIVADELDRAPLNSVSARTVQHDGATDRIMLSGLASQAVRSITVAYPDGTTTDTPVSDALLSMPITEPDGSNGGVLDVHPFLVSLAAPAGVTSLSLTAHTDDGPVAPASVAVEAATA